MVPAGDQSHKFSANFQFVLCFGSDFSGKYMCKAGSWPASPQHGCTSSAHLCPSSATREASPPLSARGSPAAACKKGSGNCKTRPWEIQRDWKLATWLNVLAFPWQLMRLKPKRIPWQLQRMMEIWLPHSDEQGSHERHPAGRGWRVFVGENVCPGCARHQRVPGTSLLVAFYASFLGCLLTEKAAENKLSFSP